MLTYRTQEPVVSQTAYLITGDSVLLDLSAVSGLQEVGGAATIEDDRLPTYLVIARPEADSYIVASSRCTHMGRALAYNHEKRVFRCSSLGKSEFDLDGLVLSGPAGRDLRIYATERDGAKLRIQLGD
jgi:Rieske Fe-S protein